MIVQQYVMQLSKHTMYESIHKKRKINERKEDAPGSINSQVIEMK